MSTTDLLRTCVIPKSRVKLTGVSLGIGAYGKVCEVDYGGKLCAAKQMHSLLLEVGSEKEVDKLKDDFTRECHLWSTLRHPNVALFLGVYYPSTDESGLPVIVMEKMKCSVTALIENHETIPLMVKLSILHDVSLGLSYLHGHVPQIVHRDLSSNNILLSRYLEAKITDLGVAKVMMTGNRKTMTKAPGTPVFMPPEALEDKPVYGSPLDVFSFGGVILHMASKQWPAPSAWAQTDPTTGKRTLLSEVERRQQYIDMITGDDTDLKPLLMSCLQDDPSRRPSAMDVSKSIKTIKETYRNGNNDEMDTILWLAEIKQSQDPKSSLQMPKSPLSVAKIKKQSKPDLLSGAVNIKWEDGAPIPVITKGHTALLYGDAIYVGGGSGGGVFHYRLDVYYPKTNKWGDAITTPQSDFGMTILTGKLLIVGGATEHDGLTKKIFMLNGSKWEDFGIEMILARCSICAVSHNSMMIVMGGYVGREICRTTELLDGTTGKWYRCNDLPQPLFLLRSAIVNDTLYVLGGNTEDRAPSKSVYAAALDTLTDHNIKWYRIADTLLEGSAAVCYKNKYLLAVGGAAARDAVCVLQSKTSWEPIGSLSTRQFYAAAVSIANQLIVIGGKDYGRQSTNKVSIGTIID